ncbi:MAG: hypothetical protein ACUVV4_02075 [Candidatus Bathyarchaeia archaeon]
MSLVLFSSHAERLRVQQNSGEHDKGRSVENIKLWIEEKSRLTNMGESLVLDLGCGTGIYISALKFFTGVSYADWIKF